MIKRFCDYCGGELVDDHRTIKWQPASGKGNGFLHWAIGPSAGKDGADICVPCLIRGLQGEVLEVRGG